MVHRHRAPVRITHWLNALFLLLMLGSGLMIFNAHPRLYWGEYGANFDPAVLEIGSTPTQGFVEVGSVRIPTTGVLGLWRDPDGNLVRRAFPWWATIPSSYDLAGARRWHLFFAWALVLNALAYMAYSLLSGHLRRDLLPSPRELRPRHILHDIASHARLRFPRGEAARRYNVLQKLSYLSVMLLLLPLVVATGLAMSPALNAAWPWLVDLLGGRQSARTLHFLATVLLTLFLLVHVAMVLLSGPWNGLRSMVTGRYRLPPEETP